MNENDSFWWKVIKAKLGTKERGWFTRLMSRPHGNGLWKKICIGKRTCHNCISRRIGKGDRVRIWHDKWMKGCPLKTQFNQIYTFAQYKEP